MKECQDEEEHPGTLSGEKSVIQLFALIRKVSVFGRMSSMKKK
jgi:hypothetical protein